jgi:hypothetical protein
MEQAIALAERNQEQSDNILVQTTDLDMNKRMQILKEEELRHN